MKTLKYIKHKYKLNLDQKKQPIEIPNTTREDLAKLFQELNYKKGAEVGVEEGIYSEVICKNNPQAVLYSIDSWSPYGDYRDHVTQGKLNSLYQKAVDRLLPYNAVIVKGYSMDVVKDFRDESLDFVYIDANHEFQYVVNDICEWTKKVKVGGIVAGHDYIRRKTNGYLMHVVMAIHGYIDSYQDAKPLFVLGRKEAKANTNPEKGELRDSTRSWFFVKRPRLPIVPHKA